MSDINILDNKNIIYGGSLNDSNNSINPMTNYYKNINLVDKYSKYYADKLLQHQNITVSAINHYGGELLNKLDNIDGGSIFSSLAAQASKLQSSAVEKYGKVIQDKLKSAKEKISKKGKEYLDDLSKNAEKHLDNLNKHAEKHLDKLSKSIDEKKEKKKTGGDTISTNLNTLRNYQTTN